MRDVGSIAETMESERRLNLGRRIWDVGDGLDFRTTVNTVFRHSWLLAAYIGPRVGNAETVATALREQMGSWLIGLDGDGRRWDAGDIEMWGLASEHRSKRVGREAAPEVVYRFLVHLPEMKHFTQSEEWFTLKGHVDDLPATDWKLVRFVSPVRGTVPLELYGLLMACWPRECWPSLWEVCPPAIRDVNRRGARKEVVERMLHDVASWKERTGSVGVGTTVGLGNWKGMTVTIADREVKCVEAE